MYGPDYGTARRPMEPSPAIYSHSRTRTTSSNVFPTQYAPMHTHLQQPQPPAGYARRSPSVNTFSTSSSNPNDDLRRSTSSRSFGAQQGGGTSYVALLRKQKATVWSDRSQTEDPRMLAQQRAAKQRAVQEVTGRTTHTRTSTGMSVPGKVVTKFRHHGKPGVVGYAPGDNYIGVGGVPLRLSATEVEGEDSDEDDSSARKLHHRRTGSSGHSSTASGRRGMAYRASGSMSKRWSPSDTPERGSIVEDTEFTPGEDHLDRAPSTHSGSSAERADALPEMAGPNAGKLASNSLLNAALTREKSVKNPEDLKRRGSVDERTMTLSSGRLFIANPDQ
ncbi:hypothetical protein F4808DRAFT_426492 [Astrocystis sublimbata]|nr:hypothetical protein F4808DRAFT_426492 [Astrocystis sublimbata]